MKKPRTPPIPIPWAVRFYIGGDHLMGHSPKAIAERYGIADVSRVSRIIRNWNLLQVYPKPQMMKDAQRTAQQRVRKVIEARVERREGTMQ